MGLVINSWRDMNGGMMKHSRLELSSEQTLRLRELRHALAETLPAGVAEAAEFPVVNYGGCGAVCMPGCTGSCTGACQGTCQGYCLVSCFESYMRNEAINF